MWNFIRCTAVFLIFLIPHTPNTISGSLLYFLKWFNNPYISQSELIWKDTKLSG